MSTSQNTRDITKNVKLSQINLDAVAELREAGFALHWLKPRSKAPVGANWSEAPVASIDQLRATYREGYNVGVRVGEPSRVGGGYLHALDLDIRVPDIADDVWAALRAMLPGVAIDALPCVASGSGGESRHLYFVTDRPFRSKRLWTSDGKHRGDDGRWHYDAEIELFGTGKQVVLPPSVHPDTGQPYRWLRAFDLELIDLGLADWPTIASADIERLAVVEHTTYAFESREPLTFKPGQFERIVTEVPISDLHYDDWIRLGQAIHHQTGGSAEGFELWLEATRKSAKFTGDKQVREMRRVKWRSFGKYRGQPVTMASIVQWAQDARVAALRASFDEEEDDDGGAGSTEEIGPKPSIPATLSPPAAPKEIDPIDAIGDGTDIQPAGDTFDDVLGGGDDEEVDEIDAIGSNTPVKGQSRAAAGDWISLLDINEDGGIKGTLHNVELIVRNDPRLVGLPQLNEFTQEVVQRTPPGQKAERRRNPAKQARQLSGPVWQVNDTLNGQLWSDDRDFAIRSILEAPKTQGGYGIKVTDRDLKAAVTLAANDNRFHPVREYLEGLTWDGAARVEQLFTQYLGAENNAYTRGVARLMLLGAVTRIFEPGHKADHVVILEGLQGKRKSTLIKVLARHWFAELDADFHDPKQCVEIMQGKFILELPELSGFGRADVRTIKAFVSRQTDRVRLAYARRAGEYPRQCIFVGTTNDTTYLLDDTGGRRWWPVACSVERIDTEDLERNVDQIWAEAVSLYRAMRVNQPHGTLPLYLSEEEAAAEATRLQQTRRPESADESLAGQIGAWLNKPIISGDIAADEPGPVRNETCVVEIWTECMGKDRISLGQRESQMIGRALKLTGEWEWAGGFSDDRSRYGKQRIWERGGLKGRLARAA